MRDFFLKLFSENNSDMTITLYSFWHIFYLVLIIGGSILLSVLLRNKSQKAKDRAIKIFAYLTIGLYVADFFIMPLSDSYSGISAYKLPFNICTLMAVFVPFVQFNSKFKPIKGVVAVLSIASSVMWMVYPGSALGGQPPFSYIIFQTFMYHGFLFAWGFLSVTIGDVKMHIKNCWKDLLGILAILVWAAFGNAVYASYDWFFITGETFPFFPKWLMPIIVVAAVFGVCIVLYGINHFVRFMAAKHRKKNLKEGKEKVRISSRAIIVEDGKLLAMFRRKIKNGEVKEYFAIPGGGLEEGESLEQNVVRELKEEMNVDIKILGYLGSRNNEEHYFHAEIVSGEVKLSGEELDRMTPENYYEPMWLDVAELDPSKINGIDIIQKAIKKEYVLLDEENQK